MPQRCNHTGLIINNVCLNCAGYIGNESQEPKVEEFTEHKTQHSYRQFHVIVANKRVALRGSHGHVWEQPYLQAECQGDKDRVAEHLTRGHGCACGIYSFLEKNNSEWLSRRGSYHWSCTSGLSILDGRAHTRGSPLPIFAQAQCVIWGKAIEGSNGWRSQYARIQGLWLNRPSEKCESCGRTIIPSTLSRQLPEVYWFCDYSDGKADQVKNRLMTELTSWYQCPVAWGIDDELKGDF